MKLIQSFVKLIGDVTGVNGQLVFVKTKKTATDGRTFEDVHPVLVPDPTALEKIKEGKKIGFEGIVRRIKNRTYLVLNPQRFTVNQSKLKDRDYMNVAGIKGNVVFKRFNNSDPSKQPQLTLGIGDPDGQNTALYASLWRDTAVNWAHLLHGHTAEVAIEGYMKSRPMLNGEVEDSIYELIGDREKCQIIKRTPIKSGFEGTPANAELYAFEFNNIPETAPTQAEQEPAKAAETDEDIPF